MREADFAPDVTHWENNGMAGRHVPSGNLCHPRHHKRGDRVSGGAEAKRGGFRGYRPFYISKSWYSGGVEDGRDETGEDGAAADKPGKGIESGQSTARGVFADKNPKHLALGKNILQQRVGINGADKLLRRFHNKRMRHITEWICELLRNHLKKDFNSS